MTVHAVWSADDFSLFADAVSLSGAAHDRDDAKMRALRAAVAAIAKMFEDRTRR